MNHPFTQISLIVMFSMMASGCYMTAHRSADVLSPGEFSVSGNYINVKPSNEEDQGSDGIDAVEYLGIEGRVGVFRGLDVGYTYAKDLTDLGGDGEANVNLESNTHWFDLKYQILNKDKFDDKLSLAIGYGFGKPDLPDLDFGDDEDDEDDVTNEMWLNHIYVTGSRKYGRLNPFATFRMESTSKDIMLVPKWLWAEPGDGDEFSEEIRKQLTVGAEFALTDMFHPVVEFGRYFKMSPTEDEAINIMTIGVNIYYNR